MGTGPKPLASTPCSCHYEGSLIDGTVFDSSFKRGTPSTFAPNQVIKARYIYACPRVAVTAFSEGASLRCAGLD
jgi:hypothetical protein